MKSEAACQLLTAIDDGTEAAARVLDPDYGVQQKFDGKRILLHIERTSVTAYNRRGLMCGISKDILTEAKRFSMFAPLMFDAEWIREINSLYSFDLLEFEGADLRPEKFIDRIGHLTHAFNSHHETSFIHQARTEVEQTGKVALVSQIYELNLEGIAAKLLNSPYFIGRSPNNYKHKRTHEASFLVIRRNQKASVDLVLFDDNNRLVEVGSVQIRNSTFNRVKEGTILDVRYMHAFIKSHQIYQPRMLRIRDDLNPDSCLLSQLRYKAANPIAV